jgi:N-acetylglucosamine-6-phosphate deacetylase
MIYTHCTIVTPKQTIENGWIEVTDGRIRAIGQGPNNGIDMKGMLCLPGFIDQHIHGGFGVDFMQADATLLAHFSRSVLAHGVTSYLATTLTDTDDTIRQALTRLSGYVTTQPTDLANCVGIHLEGPFIHPQFPGAQDQANIIAPNKATLKEYQDRSRGTIRLMTYAPEWGHSLFTTYATQLGIVPSIGHSSATLEEVDHAMTEGAKQLTHFHNASSPYHHRHPGVLNAGLYRDVQLELIVDGFHLDPLVVDGVIRLKSPHRIHCITDAISAMGQPDGPYQLGPYAVTKQAGTVRLSDNTLAGSVLTYQQLVYNLKAFVKPTLHELMQMTSYNQASLLGLTDRGAIEEGRRADLVFLDHDWTVVATMVAGTFGYQR